MPRRLHVAQYTYLTQDLLSGEILAELPLDNVQFDRAVSNPGSFTGTLILGSKKIQALSPIEATEPARTALYVIRDTQIVWGGIIWTRTYDSSSYQITIGGNEFMSYFDRRVMNASVPLDGSGADQCNWAKSLLDFAQGQQNGDIGLITGPEPMTGYTMPFGTVINPWEFRVVGQEFQQIAQQKGDIAPFPGFEYTIECSFNSWGGISKTLLWGYPQLGRMNTDWVFETRDNILKYSWPEDGTEHSNDIFEVGNGNAQVAASVEAIDADIVASGYPLIQKVINRKTVNDPTQLKQMGLADLVSMKLPIVIPTMDVHGAKDPQFGSYQLGDDARIRIQDYRFPKGIDLYYRIVGFSVTPENKTRNQIETVTLTLAPYLSAAGTLVQSGIDTALTTGPVPGL